MDQNNGFNNQNNNDYTNQYNQYNQPQQYEPQPQQYQQYAQPQQPQYDQQYAQQQQYQQYDYNQPQQYSDPYFNQQYPAYHEINNGRKGMGIASMVLGIFSVVLCCLWFVAPITSVVGLILGIISLKKEDAGKGMAIAGIILSSIGVLLGAYMIFCVVISFSSAELYDSIYSDLYSQLY